MRNRINSSFTESLVFQIPHGHKPGTFPTSLTHKCTILSPAVNTAVNWRTGSFHGYWGRRGCRDDVVTGPLGAPDHRLSVYDNVPGEQQPCGSLSLRPEESELSRLLEGQDVFSALDGVLERISRLQQLVSSWSDGLSEDSAQRASSSSSSSSSQDSPGSSAASPCPSSLGHIHLEVQHSEEEEEEVEGSTQQVAASQPSR